MTQQGTELTQRGGKGPAVPAEEADPTATTKRIDDTEVQTGCTGGFRANKQEVGDKTKKRRKELPCCIRWTMHWSFKIVPWSLVASTPIAGLTTLGGIWEKMGWEKWGTAYTISYAFTLWICIQIMYNFVMASILEPGFVKDQYIPPPKKNGKYKLATVDTDDSCKSKPCCAPKNKEIEMDTELETKRKGEGAAAKKCDDKPLDLWYAPRWDQKCEVWKPPRSHHDSITGRCVLRMDHYCPFTGNVIAVNNHGHFVLMYMFALAALLWGAVFAFIAVQMAVRENTHLLEQRVHTASKEWQAGNYAFFLNPLYLSREAMSLVTALVNHAGVDVCIFTGLEILFLLVVLSCGGPAMYFACVNVTALEYNLPSLNEYVEISDQVFCPLGPYFYDLGSPLENLKQIFGTNWFWRVLLPVRGNVDWVRTAYNPPCSAEAVAQIRLRIQQWEEEGSRLQTKSYAELGITAPAPEEEEDQAPPVNNASANP
ncbi:unnamed protein product [Amoebophrya sp. A120]|nr:unnamed protein product [Amoebophrya sp. A120]|eukprot:GSA120T00017445001.1